MKQLKSWAIIVLAATTMIQVSCFKEEVSPLNSKTQNHNLKTMESLNIPYFTNVEEMERAIELANSFFSTDSLVQYENSHGIYSIGRLADEFYETINTTDDDNLDGLALWQNHQNLLDTTHLSGGELCIEPKWFRSPYRYVANENGMFAVGETVFKLFKEGPVSTSIDNAAGLLALTESDLSSADTSIYHKPIICNTSLYDHPNCAYLLKVKNTPVTYNDRLFIELNTTFIHFLTENFQNEIVYFTQANTQVKIYNRHRWSGVWWISKHTYTGSGNVTIHRLEGSDFVIRPTDTFNKTKKRISLTIDVHEEDVSDIGFSEMLFTGSKYYHYLSYNIQASYPGHAPEFLIH